MRTNTVRNELGRFRLVLFFHLQFKVAILKIEILIHCRSTEFEDPKQKRPPTCEEAAVVLLYFLRRLKLLLGMFLREFVPQVLRVPLLSEDTFHQQDLDSQPSQKLISFVTSRTNVYQ